MEEPTIDDRPSKNPVKNRIFNGRLSMVDGRMISTMNQKG